MLFWRQVKWFIDSYVYIALLYPGNFLALYKVYCYYYYYYTFILEECRSSWYLSSSTYTAKGITQPPPRTITIPSDRNSCRPPPHNHNATSGHFTGHISTRTYSPFCHYHSPIYTIKRSTVNVYRIDRDRSIRVNSMGKCQFSNFRFNNLGNVLGGEENCPGGWTVRVICRRGNVLHSTTLTLPIKLTQTVIRALCPGGGLLSGHLVDRWEVRSEKSVGRALQLLC